MEKAVPCDRENHRGNKKRSSIALRFESGLNHVLKDIELISNKVDIMI